MSETTPRHITSLSKMDTVGAFASAACALHCILVPLILTAWPLVGLSILSDHTVEKWVLVGTVSLALVSLCWGTHVHKNKHVLFLLAFAVTCFLVAHAVLVREHYIFMTLGGLSLAAGHILNMRLCRSCAHCECEEHSASVNS